MSGKFALLNSDQFERLQSAMENYAGRAGRIVDDVLHTEGAQLISGEIMRLLPASNRTWKGKKPAARNAQPFTQEDGSMSVTVKTKSAYHYLYFPDDGTNTKRHRGEQYFMQRGAENTTDEIIDRCIAKLTENWSES